MFLGVIRKGRQLGEPAGQRGVGGAGRRGGERVTEGLTRRIGEEEKEGGRRGFLLPYKQKDDKDRRRQPVSANNEKGRDRVHMSASAERLGRRGVNELINWRWRRGGAGTGRRRSQVSGSENTKTTRAAECVEMETTHLHKSVFRRLEDCFSPAQ